MIRIGVDYYPEHWDRSLWSRDLDLMKKAGVTTVRIAEFMWGLLEPSEGEFHFELLDDFVKMAGDAGIELILGTPTNCPPMWMYRNYPETLSVERTGLPTETGIRGHRCIENPLFRSFAADIIDRMAERYGKNPHVIGWQIDNELSANHCNCRECTHKFQEWLRRKYGTPEAMNKAWGADIWSGQISDWSQVQTPKGQMYSYGWLNPGYMLDYERFAAESTAGYIAFQIRELRKYVPESVPITTNACFCEHTMDFHRSFKDLDIAGYDNYPGTKIPDDPDVVYTTAADLDLMRGVKRKNFWMLEQLSGPMGCWGEMQPVPRPGMLKGYALQTIAHGADMVLFWRWRSAVKGAETFCQGLISHSNVPGRRFREFADTAKTVHELQWLDGTVVKSPVTILWGFEQFNAFKTQYQSPGFDYRDQVKRWQAAYASLGVNVDIIDEEQPLDGYRVVVVPAHYVTSPVTAARVDSFVRGGGTVLVTCRSGVKDKDNGCILSPLPTAFRKVCGCSVDEYDPIGKKDVQIAFPDETLTGSVWCDLLLPEGADIRARYASEFYAGTAAITKNHCGSGTCFYMGVCGKRPLMKRMAKETLESAGVPFIADLPDNVWVNTRESGDGSVRGQFIFNETDREQSFMLDGETMSLAPFEMKIRRIR